jgi:hypothetical protein
MVISYPKIKTPEVLWIVQVPPGRALDLEGGSFNIC